MKNVESYLVINQVKHYMTYRFTNHIYTVCLDMDINVNSKLGYIKIRMVII